MSIDLTKLREAVSKLPKNFGMSVGFSPQDLTKIIHLSLECDEFFAVVRPTEKNLDLCRAITDLCAEANRLCEAAKETEQPEATP